MTWQWTTPDMYHQIYSQLFLAHSQICTFLWLNKNCRHDQGHCCRAQFYTYVDLLMPPVEPLAWLCLPEQQNVQITATLILRFNSSHNSDHVELEQNFGLLSKLVSVQVMFELNLMIQVNDMFFIPWFYFQERESPN